MTGKSRQKYGRTLQVAGFLRFFLQIRAGIVQVS
jgi:hypothetical protein